MIDLIVRWWRNGHTQRENGQRHVDLRMLIMEVNDFLSYIASVDENYSLPKPMYAISIQHSVVRFHVVCGHFVIILCLQIDRANLRFGQMAISEKHHRHRQLTYTNLGSSTSPSSDLKLYWWTLTPTQVFLELWMMMRFGFNFKRQYARAIITIWL